MIAGVVLVILVCVAIVGVVASILVIIKIGTRYKKWRSTLRTTNGTSNYN